MNNPAEKTPVTHYVGMNMRLFASLVDVFLLIVVMMILDPVLKTLFPLIHEMFGVVVDNSGFHAALSGEKRVLMVLKAMQQYGVLSKLVVDVSVSFILYGFLIIPFWIFKSATPGKMLICARIVDVNTLEKPSNIKFIIRYIAYLISAVPAGFGLFWCTLNVRRRSWHDIIAGTLVVYNDDGWVPRLALRFSQYTPSPLGVLGFYKAMLAKMRK